MNAEAKAGPKPMTESEILAALALAERATGEPWEFEPKGGLSFSDSIHSESNGAFIVEWAGGCANPGDPAFVAASRALVPKLANECLRLRRALMALRRGDYCWCEIAIGNPMMRSHTAACDFARLALGENPE